MSIAVRNNMHFVLYHYCCKGRYSVNIYLTCLEISGNLIMTGVWPPWIFFTSSKSRVFGWTAIWWNPHDLLRYFLIVFAFLVEIIPQRDGWPDTPIPIACLVSELTSGKNEIEFVSVILRTSDVWSFTWLTHVYWLWLQERTSSLEHLLEALDYGCPPHGGIALGT